MADDGEHFPVAAPSPIMLFVVIEQPAKPALLLRIVNAAYPDVLTRLAVRPGFARMFACLQYGCEVSHGVTVKVTVPVQKLMGPTY